MPRRREQPLEHRLLLTATFCLLAGGAVMVYSASSARTLLQGQGDGTAYLVKYLAYGAVGLVAMHVLSKHGLGAARRYSPILLLIAFVLLLAVLLPGIGLKINGARRWLGAGPLRGAPPPPGPLAARFGAAARGPAAGDGPKEHGRPPLAGSRSAGLPAIGGDEARARAPLRGRARRAAEDGAQPAGRVGADPR